MGKSTAKGRRSREDAADDAERPSRGGPVERDGGPVGLPEAAAFQYAATVRLSRRYRLAMSLKLGFMPDSLYMFSSPIMLSPTAGSFRKTSICSDRA